MSIEALPPRAGLCRSGPITSLANHGNKMESLNSNESICEEMFGRKMDVTEKTPDPFESEKSQVRLFH